VGVEGGRTEFASDFGISGVKPMVSSIMYYFYSILFVHLTVSREEIESGYLKVFFTFSKTIAGGSWHH
jgi:hypothetical protein